MSPITSTRLSFALFFSTTTSLFAWIFSRRAIDPSESSMTWALNTPSVAKAGFPIEAFELPSSPLGSDFIPAQMYRGLLLNSLFWLAIGTIAALLLVRYAPAWSQKKKEAACLAGIIAFALHGLLFGFWFD